jgi:hypothetical protein
VPHAVGVDDVAAGVLGDLEHPAVDVRRHAGDHASRWVAEAGGPRPAHEVVVAADASRRDDDRLRAELEVPDLDAGARSAALDGRRLEDGPADPGHDAARLDEGVDAVPEGEPDEPARDALPDPTLERLDEAGARAPRDVEARHGVAVSVRPAVAALGPADHREEPQALLAQPGTLLAGREVEIRVRPLARPEVLLAVELCAAHPVLGGELEAVPDAHAPLLGRVDEEEPAERPEGLAAEALLALLVDEHDPLARVDELGRRDEPGESCAHDDDVGVH